MSRRSFDIEHVLMTADAVGGVWTYCMELARGLARHGVRVTLATMGPAPTPSQREEAQAIPGLDLRVSPFKLEWMHQAWSDVDAAGDWLLALADRIRPDVVHLNGYVHAALPWPAPTMVVCHSDILSWWSAVHGGSAPMDEWGEYARRVKEGLRSAGLVVAPTSAALDEVEQHYGVLDAARVVHYGRNPDELSSGPKRAIVLSSGRYLDEGKNLALIREVAPEIDWPVYLAGEVGEQRPHAPCINFLGRLTRPAVSAWLSRASIFAFPAKYEPGGMSILEAAFSGCALVLGDIPSLRELWDGAALFVDPLNANALREAINGLIADDPRRKQLARLAQERAKQYTAASMACSTLFAYQDLKQTNLLDLATFGHPGVSLR